MLHRSTELSKKDGAQADCDTQCESNYYNLTENSTVKTKNKTNITCCTGFVNISITYESDNSPYLIKITGQ